jgi:hypothetical protein
MFLLFTSVVVSMDTTEVGEGDGHEFKWWWSRDVAESVGLGDGVLVVLAVVAADGGERIGISLLEASLTPPNILL